MSLRLNPAQLEAVEHQEGPLLILAGAGSGKTRVITQRIVRLLKHGVPARAIAALTFTNKAAGEMRERVADLLGSKGRVSSSALTISTFHSFGLQVLKEERRALGGTFTIFDQGDAVGAIKECMRSINIGRNLDAFAILSRISNAKNAFMQESDMPEVDEYDEVAKVIFPKYQSALRQFRAYDFDDLVCEVARLWETQPAMLHRWRERYRYLMVDEYQDTNRAQLQLLRQLAEPYRNICVVGDDDQSIYAWRGADVRNILEFEDHFKGAKVIKLEQNYRSVSPVLAVANAAIAKRTDAKYPKALFTSKTGGEPVEAVVASTPEAEASFVAREARRHIKEGTKAEEVAVLYRSNSQSTLIEAALRENGVPYRLIGGTQFFERKEVKDLLAYAKVAINSYDEISLRRIINYPARGIGETGLEKLTTGAFANGWTLWQAVERADGIDSLPSPTRSGCRALERVIQNAQGALARGEPASAMLRGIADEIGLRLDVDVSSANKDAASRRWGNVEALFNTFERRERRLNNQEAAHGKDSLANFLQALMLDFGGDDDDTKSAVVLSTLHGAKGLEFDVVFLIGLEEGILPHARTLDTKLTDSVPADIEEERRLFYVGVTRAKSKLYLSRATARITRGKAFPRTPSRFLLDVPEELLLPREVTDEPSLSTDEMALSADALLAALASLGG
jgi:DNA helicase-2/ATP-dependent DNA helicase PcrA